MPKNIISSSSQPATSAPAPEQPAATEPPVGATVIATTLEDALKYFKELKARVFDFAGKTGYNPYLWWARHGADLENRIKIGENNPGLIIEIMSLRFSEPKAGTGLINILPAPAPNYPTDEKE